MHKLHTKTTHCQTTLPGEPGSLGTANAAGIGTTTEGLAFIITPRGDEFNSDNSHVFKSVTVCDGCACLTYFDI